MVLSSNSRYQFAPDLNICRILNGLWQVSGAHGRINSSQAIQSMFDYVDAGYTTWDLADHYGPAEDFIGEFRKQFAAARGKAELAQVQAFTKWVPRSGPMTRRIVEDNINISLRRMNTDRLDLLQFHWWDYGDRHYLTALEHLTTLQAEGKIRHLALTNFDTPHLKTILDNGIKILSNQVQYSLIDQRPQVQMENLCQETGVKLLTYGTLCGGMLSEKYLGQPEPRGGSLDTVSLRKYKNMVDAWGDWSLFQSLLSVLQDIAQKHGVRIPNVAVRAILDRPGVGVIVGARLSIAEHREANAAVFDLKLDESDRQKSLPFANNRAIYFS